MINETADDELTQRCKTAESLFQDYRSRITYGDPAQATYNTDQAKFWLGKYKRLKLEIEQRDNPESA